MEFGISGPEPFQPLPQDCLGKIIYDSLLQGDSSKNAMIDVNTGKTISYRKLLEESCNLAQALRNYGCTTETVVSVCSENQPEYLIPIIASLCVGTIMAPVNNNYTIDELKHNFSITEPKIIFCEERIVEKLIEIQKRLPFIEKIILIDSDKNHRGLESLREFVKVYLRGDYVVPEEFRPFNENAAEQIAFVLSSSGTTGLPKGVALTHTNVITRVAQVREPRYLNRSSIMLFMPLFHGFGLNQAIVSIVSKDFIVSFRRFDEDVFLKAIEDYRPSYLWLVPPLVIFLAKTPKLDKYDLSSVREVFSGGAAVGSKIAKVLENRLKLKYVRQAYGLTEANLGVTYFENDDQRFGSVGKVITFATLTVRDPETGQFLGPNQVGEICVKGPSVMKGYYKNIEATKATFTEDGWLRSGDLGYYDDDKYFYIVERLKELIKYKGYQVAPAELEGILINHPKVLDVGIVGVPDELCGELPMAFIVKKKGMNVTEKELQEFVAKKVSPQKRLRGGVVFVSSIPRTPSGKIMRRELKKLLSSHQPQIDSKL